jgi:glycosyltransferase involved in cell wall biosynthesis
MRLIICAKSQWNPPIRREHAIATSAAADGHEIVFIEQATHVLAIRGRSSVRSWVGGWRAPPTAHGTGVSIERQSTMIPGHHSSIAERMDGARLARTLRRVGSEYAVVVAMLPWQWPAVASAPARRRVFDCADDWRALIPSRAPHVQDLYSRIGRDADAVISVSSDLQGAFGPRRVAVIPNGVDEALVRTPLTPIPAAQRLVYVGTLSERFNAPLLLEALDRLPGWTADLYGQCRYAGCGDKPSPELRTVLRASGGRIRWHGPVHRSQLAGVLDRGRVLVAPHRGSLTFGQDSMKLYDYAARARPIVATRGGLGAHELVAGAGVFEVDSAMDFATTIAGLSSSVDGAADGRRGWLDDHSWSGQWKRWSEVVFGCGPTGGAAG